MAKKNSSGFVYRVRHVLTGKYAVFPAADMDHAADRFGRDFFPELLQTGQVKLTRVPRAQLEIELT